MSVVKKLKRPLGDFDLDITDWTISDQGITVLWGPSGAGKTTLVHALLGLDSKAEVSWMWGDQDLADLPVEKRNLGVVFQNNSLFPHLSARENILFPVDKKIHSHWQQDFDFLVKSLKMESYLETQAKNLSGGERQRVALARALIYRPKMLFLDEPFSSLDEDLRKQARQALQDVVDALKCPVLLISHDRQDVEALAQKVCKIERGKIVKEGSNLEFKS